MVWGTEIPLFSPEQYDEIAARIAAGIQALKGRITLMTTYATRRVSFLGVPSYQPAYLPDDTRLFVALPDGHIEEVVQLAVTRSQKGNAYVYITTTGERYIRQDDVAYIEGYNSLADLRVGDELFENVRIIVRERSSEKIILCYDNRELPGWPS